MSVVDHNNLGFRDRRNVNTENFPDNQIVCDILNGAQKMMMMMMMMMIMVVVVMAVVVIVMVMRNMMVVIYHGNDENSHHECAMREVSVNSTSLYETN